MTTVMSLRAGLSIETSLVEFIENDVLPGTALEPDAFWQDLAAIFSRFTPRNAALLAERDRMQAEIDAWHDAHPGASFDADAYREFLTEIGYLVPEPAPFQITPENVDPELASIAGPQLVVPVLNARFLLNAANARWGSLYDALYGTDALPGETKGAGYDAARGAQAIAWTRAFLDRTIPLAEGSWSDFAGGEPRLADPSALVGRREDSLLLCHNGLHIEILIDRGHPVGANDPAGIADILLEAAVTTIVDLEDSVAAVDGPDKKESYANWLGLMKGDLEASFVKAGKPVIRHLAPDRVYSAQDGTALTLRGRSLLLVRNVGHLMRTPAVLMPDGSEAFEGILDAIVTSLIALHDLDGLGRFRNSLSGSIYIVKPKMHGPDEAAFANDLFDAVEDMLGLDRHTIKIGVMDEERRTSANLAACIDAVRERVVFINTGFLDRTGDEIHTGMHAGPMLPKGEMKTARWLTTYENRNVQIGLQSGFAGKAQIGKGMWAAPDRMADMLEQKIAHPKSGASTAWVPSPTAAVLHATHYHDIDVAARQRARQAEAIGSIDDLLSLPLGQPDDWTTEQISREIDNNAQGILGYVVRWIDQGVGCSKVPDINNVGLMEDRATLRISAQSLANWLHHGVCTEADIEAGLVRMANKVDGQNTLDPNYEPMSADPEGSIAFQTARALIREAATQPNGYTEPLLHLNRLKRKRCADAKLEHSPRQP